MRQHWGAKHALVIAAMHETPARFEENLRRQLEWASRHFRLIGPDDLSSLWQEFSSDSKSGSKPALLFTFDDGRESNYEIAAPFLESFGARGIFFVVPDFVGRTGDDARQFYYSQIDVRGLPPSDSPEVWTPMNHEQLRDLASRGHAIGSHTLSHVRVDGLGTDEARRQIVASAEKIFSWTRKPVDCFAWPYSWSAIDRSAWKLIRSTYRFCFAPCPGTVDTSSDSPHLIWRNEVESYYSEAEYRFMYSGLVDPFWASRRKNLRTRLHAE